MQNEDAKRKQALDYRNQLLDGLVDGVTVYNNGCAVLRRTKCNSVIPISNRVRGKIVELSAKSRAKMLFVITATGTEFGSMITLTYPLEYPKNGRVAKGHLDDFLRSYKHRYGGQYFWFLEFQNRGAPHFHVLVSRSNVFSSDRKWMALRWANVMGINEGRRYSSILDYREKDLYQQVLRVNTHPKAWQAIVSEDGARRYVAKYALKTYQKDVPEEYQDVGRFYGYSRGVRNTIREIDHFDVSAETIRQVLRQEGHKVADWDYLPKILFGVSSFNGLTSVL